MNKKVIISIIIIVALGAAAYFYFDNRNRTLSPPGSASTENNGLAVKVDYSRPSVRGRLIFGEESQSALQPYGKYWRLGANESTEIEFSKNVTFNGIPVNAGRYRMYAIPGADNFEIRLNTVIGKWGAFEPDYSKDILTTKVPVTKNNHVEQHTISLVNNENGVDVVVEWSDVKLTIPVRPQ